MLGRAGAQMQRRRAFPSKSSAGLPASGLSGTIPHAKCRTRLPIVKP